jgi:hypothetical protein
MGPLLIVLVMGFQASYSPGTIEALRKSAEASYIQTGLQDYVIEKEKALIGKELRAVLGNSAFITKTIVEQRVTFSWGF